MARVTSMQESSSLLEVVDRILDKGIVIDVWLTVSALGLELLTLEARIVVASCETYMKYAEGIGLTMNVARPLAAPRPVAPPLVVPPLVVPPLAVPPAAAPQAAQSPAAQPHSRTPAPRTPARRTRAGSRERV